MGIFENATLPFEGRKRTGNGDKKKKPKKPSGDGKMQRIPGGNRTLIFVVLYVLTVLVMGIGYMGRSQSISEGLPSPASVTAQNRVTFESDLLTEQRRAEAISGITPVMSVNAEAIDAVEEEIRNTFSLFRDLRRRALEEEIDGTGLVGIIGESERFEPFMDLTEEELDSLVGRESGEFALLEDYTAGLVRKNMEPGVQQPGLEIVRQNMLEEVTTGNLDTPAKALVSGVIRRVELLPTLLYDDAATQARREEVSLSVEPVSVTVEAGEVIVREGQIVTPEINEKLQAADTSLREHALVGVLGIALLVLISYVILAWYLFHYRPEVPEHQSYLVLLAVLVLFGVVINEVFAGIAHVSASGPLFFYMAPLAAIGVLTAILLDNEVALMVAVILGVFLGLVSDTALAYAAVAVFSSFVGVFSVARVAHRSDLMKSGLYIGGANLAAILGLGSVLNYGGPEFFRAALFGLAGGFLASVLAIGILPYFELMFKITTPLKLLELSDPNQPLLKQLLLEAPGTYHHSIVVSNLAEAGAESVGANSLLARVGAYYHDIGKIKRPYFFIENQQLLSDNPHDKLSPRLSTLIITSHVKDGLEMAREHKLPPSVQQFIRTHHGNSLVGFFYNKARDLEGKDIKDDAFRYEGPKPITKEAAIVMLADTVEASVRSIKNPNPGRIEGFVRKVIKDKFEAGQLSESKLTFRELETIAKAFIRVLSGIYHQRVEYPDQLAAEMERSKKKGGYLDSERRDELPEPADGTAAPEDH